VVAAVSTAVAACSDSGHPRSRSAGTPAVVAATGGPRADQPPMSAAAAGIDLTHQDACDPLVPSKCMLPFPNDHFTAAAHTATGRRLALRAESLPANTAGVHIDPTDLDQMDGFSPGSPLIVELPGHDPMASPLPGAADMAASVDSGSAIVVLDADTGDRLAVWVDVDARADAGTAPLLIVHPAANWPEGHRIVVGLRGMRGAAGPLAPSPAFLAYRDGQRITDATFEHRRPAMEEVFRALGTAGVDRSTLTLAWGFTVGSAGSITGRLLAMRDDTFSTIDSQPQKFTVTSVSSPGDPRVWRQVDGTFEVPLYLTGTGEPGSRLVVDAKGVPRRQPGAFTAAFRCNIPPSASSGGNDAGPAVPARSALYGHGLLGSLDELGSDMVRDMGANHNIVYCATNFYGMSEEDVANAVAALGDLSEFASIPDRSQQGFVAMLVLGHLMGSAGGFGGSPAFHAGGRSMLEAGGVAYDGNSQGAILGGPVCAVATEIRRCVLGEAGMDYALLLDRSVDFDEYLNAVFAPAYPTRDDRVLGIALASTLWDRAEVDGYAAHLTDHPLPHTPKHSVLLLGAVGDHQVTELSLRVEARTAGIPARTPLAAAGRTPEKDPAFGLEAARFPHAGSLYLLVDTGSPASPVANTPPRGGHDPHDDTPNVPEVQELKDQFLTGRGAMADPCPTGTPCRFVVPEANAD